MTNAMKLKSTLFATLFAGASTVAMAQGVEFATVDTDGDGMLSMDEIKTLLPDVPDDQLVAADANGDGMLDEAEYQVLTGG
ncbi:hypothetical protein [Pararhizobium sp. IMCC21322]|uniref:hypothetical protein n=1 Tax=Pararhizobium sp. IMCC21322 TaxID=3067903 RepID=UPI00274134B9|nr:hypothetical protein [Pararhizobium sp. IMCC21322]